MYLQRTTKYGNRIKVRKYRTARYGVKGERRRKREKPSSLAIEQMNERRREEKFEQLMINNFTSADWYLTLTYRKEERPDEETAKRQISKFFRDARRIQRKAGEELRYMSAAEGLDSKTGNIHFHIVISAGAWDGKVQDLWPYGRVKMEHLYKDYDYHGLAVYMLKEQEARKRSEFFRQAYACSRNLVKPEEKVEIRPANCWREKPAVPASLKKLGYEIDAATIYQGVDLFSYPYQEYVMVRREKQKHQRK